MATQIKLRRDTDTNWTANSTVVLAEGEIGVNLTNGQFKLGNGLNTWAQLTYFQPGTSSSLVNGSNSISIDATGALVYPNGALQRDTATVACPGNASTVVYTASGQYQHTIKLLIQVEGFEGTGPMNGFDTQACEMIIAKSFRGDDVASTVYGVVHTSVAPLATFTAQWNATANRVEVLCTTPNANMVSVRIFATEITTSD